MGWWLVASVVAMSLIGNFPELFNVNYYKNKLLFWLPTPRKYKGLTEENLSDLIASEIRKKYR